jgi:conjugal transfer/entry exclusion protein
LVNVFASTKKKEETNPNEIKQAAKPETTPAQFSGEPATVLQKIKLEESQLEEEKKNLAQLKEQLQKKITNQIENSMGNLQKLRSEVSELKAECAQLNETLQNEVFTE